MMSAGHRARKRFGQHFLVDDSVIHRIIRAVHPVATDRLIEIGPGLGALTLPLLSRGMSLTLIELDRDLVLRWQAYPAHPPLTVIAQDVLTVDFSQFGQSLRLIGNLPYNISTPFLFHLAADAQRYRDAHFMLQKEVVERMVATPGSRDYGRLSVMLQYHFDMESLMDVEADAFDPPPKVRSAVVRLIPRMVTARPDANFEHLSTLVTTAFAQRRKMLRVSLKNMVSEDDLKQAGIDPTRRAETVSLEEFCRLSLSEGRSENK